MKTLIYKSILIIFSVCTYSSSNAQVKVQMRNNTSVAMQVIYELYDGVTCTRTCHGGIVSISPHSNAWHLCAGAAPSDRLMVASAQPTAGCPGMQTSYDYDGGCGTDQIGQCSSGSFTWKVSIANKHTIEVY